jgi:hypothetical protein
LELLHNGTLKQEFSPFSQCAPDNPRVAFPYPKWITNFLGEETQMDEKTLITLWHKSRTQIIQAQVAPALVLIAITVLAAFGKFDTANDATKYLALGVAAATGILAIISQYAAVREGEALLVDLRKVEKRSALADKIADSRGLLSLSAIAIVGLGIAIFALVTWAVLG